MMVSSLGDHRSMVPVHFILAVIAVQFVSLTVGAPLFVRDLNAQRCGASWEDANKKCGTLCPNNVDRECNNGEKCYSDLDISVCSTPGSGPAPAPQPQPNPTVSVEYPPAPKWLSSSSASASSAPIPAPQPQPTENELVNDNGGPLRCGSSWENANSKCGTPCPAGVDRQCSNGETCFKDLNTSVCTSGNGPAPTPQPQPTISDPTPAPQPQTTISDPAPAPQPQPEPTHASKAVTTTPIYNGNGGGDGTIGQLVSESQFNSALSACGISKPDMYASVVAGFTIPLANMEELALLMGNMAHESGGFFYTEEIMCAGVTSPTSKCPYGLYHGRGYIQLSWEANYKSASTAIGKDLVSNPDLVMNDLATNWATVSWYWQSSVQPTLKSSGYTLANSVKSINGALECGGNPISPQRVKYINCFEQQFTGTQSYGTSC
ncbi:lysozyme-like domain-containing protein [Chytriomyces sp. MP71]|nr:lysozyme-like domain-containing protein [Chytriomyces sp. MP71]